MGRHRNRWHGGDQRERPGHFMSGIPRFIEPVLLLLLQKRGPAYGYELIPQAVQLSLSGEVLDGGSIYRVLRDMEARGLVVSRWDAGSMGAPRRFYQITGPGKATLEAWTHFFHERRNAMGHFISLYNNLK